MSAAHIHTDCCFLLLFIRMEPELLVHAFAKHADPPMLLVWILQVNEEFLEYTRSKGNDLSTPAPQYNFPGLKPGDRWCLCASR